MRWEVVEMVPCRRLVYRTTAPDSEGTLTKLFEPRTDGSRYDQALEFTLRRPPKPISWLIERLVIRRKMAADFERVVAAIKGIVEREHAQSSPQGEAGRSP